MSLTRVSADGRPLDAAALVPQEPDAYHAALRAELAEQYGLTGGFEILGATEEAVISRFHLHGPAADAGTLTTVDAPSDQPFRRAMRMECTRLSGEFWHTMVQALSPVPVKQGDLLVVSLYARGGVQGVAGSPGLTGVSIKPIPGDPHGFGGRELVLDADRWQRVLFPVTATSDTAAGKLEWVSVLSTKLQWLEFGGMSVINFGSGAGLTKLLEATTRPGTYAGREADARWRAEALARIERHRKADLAVVVVDAAGKPVPGAQVNVEMTEHAFRFGTAAVPRFDAWEGDVPDWAKAANETFRKHAYKLFNHVAVDIDLKHEAWYGASDDQKRYIVDAIDTLRRHGMTIHGHTMVWPGFHNMQAFAKFKDDPAKLQSEILGHIRDQAAWLGDRCLTWDVLSEPYGNQEISRIVGFDGMVEWFRVAREALPSTTKLAINEGITPGGGGATEAYYLDITRQLIEAGAPIDSIGLQCHVGANPPAIADVWASLERLASLKPGVELAVTEFDINCRGDTALEGDFTRDLLLLTFSHPQMTGFTMWGFHDPYHWLQYAPLFKQDGTLKESGKAWMGLVRGEWWTKASGKTDAAGTFRSRGFFGEYRATITHNGKSIEHTFVLPREGDQLRVILN